MKNYADLTEEERQAMLDSEAMLDSNYWQCQADTLDAMADLAEEERQAMRDSDYWEWDGVEEISSEERNACDHYNERYVLPYYD